MSDIGPGDWVECVDARPGPVSGAQLVEGALYCVIEIRTGPFVGYRGTGLILEGVRCGKEGWRHERFRPIRDGQERITRRATDKVPA